MSPSPATARLRRFRLTTAECNIPPGELPMSSKVLFSLRHAAFLALCASAAYGSGRLLAVRLARMRFGSASEETAVCAGAGLGAWGAGIFLLGLLGQIRPLPILALAAASALAG